MNVISYELRNICKIRSGKRLPKGTDFSDRITNHKYIRARDIKAGKINGSELVYITEDIHDKLSRYIVNTDDIVITIVGASVGDVAYVTEEFDGINLTENAVRLTDFEDCVNSKYLMYILNSKKYWELMQQIAGGSAQPKLGIYKIEAIVVELPEKGIQDRIVEILSTYDDLIENNQKQITLLEEAAQRLYKEWFVDLRFPGHETTPLIEGVPQGWRKLPLGELIEYEIGGGWGEDQPTEKCDLPAYVIRGTDLYDVTHGNAKSIPYRFHAKSNLNSRKLQDGDIVFEVSGGSKNEGVARTALITESLIDFLGGDVMCASFCKLIRFKDKSIAKYMYDTFQYLRNSGETVKYDKRSASSIVNYRWKDFLEQQLVFVPTVDVLKRYNALAENMQKTIVNKAQIIEQAKQARDRLLPKLMSGELEV